MRNLLIALVAHPSVDSDGSMLCFFPRKMPHSKCTCKRLASAQESLCQTVHNLLALETLGQSEVQHFLEEENTRIAPQLTKPSTIFSEGKGRDRPAGSFFFHTSVLVRVLIPAHVREVAHARVVQV